MSSYRGRLPDPGIDPGSPALAGKFFTTSATWAAGLTKAESWQFISVSATTYKNKASGT